MNNACHYAIVRFMPFVETGEFGNVGIIMFSPTARYFGFRLITKRVGRITNFFEQMDAQLFRASMHATRDELQRVSNMLKGMGTDRRMRELDREAAVALWQEILKPRGSMVRFSDPRLIMTAEPQSKLSELYAYYVERSFATKEHQEKLLERSVRGFLKQAQVLDHFHEQRIGNEEYNAQFPFVASNDEDEPIKVIKPLRLDHALPAQIIDHGGQWRVRIEALQKRDLLPSKVLFAISGETRGETAQARALRDVVASLVGLGVQVQPANNREAVIDFALS